MGWGPTEDPFNAYLNDKKNGAFLARPDTILFQAANKTFSCPSGLYKRSFSQPRRKFIWQK
jgi:hypothetical protein